MIDDEYQLFGEQPWINGVADIPCATNAVISFEVPIIVPAKCRNSISVRKTESIKGVCQLLGPGKTFFVGISVTWVVHSYRHDFTITVIFRTVLRNR